ncbi:MAG: hypothetical protein N2445_09495, partial [Acidobacteria bacterium]|nr:hypothetical protein [Acidobacteriota bacterium]
DLVCRKNDLYSKGEINIIVDSIKNENQVNIETEVNAALNSVASKLQRDNELHVENNVQNNVETDKEEEFSF